jgi:hypothetical protein
MAGPDLRFALIEDIAALVKLLPAPDLIVWPTEPGDLEALDQAFAAIGILPKVRASFAEHKRATKARRALQAAMVNGTR